MLWCDFEARLKKLSKNFWLDVNNYSTHPEYPWMKIIGIHYGDKHLCSVTYDQAIPYKDVMDDRGILLNQGYETVIRHLMTPERTRQKNGEDHFFNAGLRATEIERVMRVDLSEIGSAL